MSKWAVAYLIGCVAAVGSMFALSGNPGPRMVTEAQQRNSDPCWPTEAQIRSFWLAVERPGWTEEQTAEAVESLAKGQASLCHAMRGEDAAGNRIPPTPLPPSVQKLVR